MSDQPEQPNNEVANAAKSRRRFISNVLIGGGVALTAVGAEKKAESVKITKGAQQLGIEPPSNVDQLRVPLLSTRISTPEAFLTVGPAATFAGVIEDPSRRQVAKALGGTAVSVAAAATIGKIKGTKALEEAKATGRPAQSSVSPATPVQNWQGRRAEELTRDADLTAPPKR